MRALLRSEPFCGWGLKLAFFTEWSWLAYQRLEALQQHEESNSAEPTALRLHRYSRSGKPLHPLYPVAVCDFTGVDGKRIPLVHVSQQQRLSAGVADQPVKKRQTSKKKEEDDKEAAQWPETLPRSANLKGLDACIQDLDTFPMPPPVIASSDLTKKAKRITKASKGAAAEQNVDEEEDGASDEEVEDAEPVLGSAPPANASARALRRMRFDDTDVEEMEWKQFEHVVANRGQSISDFMQTCVDRHVAAQDARTTDAAPPAPSAPCSMCREPIDLTRQLDFALCPEPQSGTQPVVSSSSATVPEDQSPTVDAHSCSSIFHVSCLADSFLQQQQSKSVADEANSSRNTVLPTHGSCPSHTCGSEVATWADVVRGMYRRHERFERLLHFLVRSGKTLEEHLNPTEVEAPAKAPKARSKAKATRKEVDADDGEDTIDTGKKPKASKAKRKSATNTEGETTGAEEEVLVEERSKAKKKAPARKAKGVVDLDQIIDLT